MKKEIPEKRLEHLLQLEKDFEKRVGNYRKSTLERFPFIFVGISTFGAVMIFYGFEKIIDRIDFLANNPGMMLGFGFTLLLVTGAVYRKL